MAKGDLEIIGKDFAERKYRTKAANTAINGGDAIMIVNTNYAGVLTDAKPVVATDNFLGIAQGPGSETSALDGRVTVGIPTPNIGIIRGKAKSAAAVDTDAELIALLFTFVLFDLTAGVYTIDTAVAANSNGLRIEDGDIVRGTVDVTVDGRNLRTVVA